MMPEGYDDEGEPRMGKWYAFLPISIAMFGISSSIHRLVPNFSRSVKAILANHARAFLCGNVGLSAV